MPKLPRISGSQAIKSFEKFGYRVVRQKGSHIRLKYKNNSLNPLTIPLHKELGTGLLRRLLRDSQMSVTDFIKLLK